MVKRIAHTGDVHIFNNKRHDEHREIISTLKEVLIKEEVDLIYVGGDIEDSKSKLSPEQIDLINFFFYSLSEVAPVIVILGNHDTNLQNKSRLDSLTPLIAGINGTYPIYYLKDTGIYNLYDINWAVWSRLDDRNPFEGMVERLPGYTIGCYHGPIKGVKTYNGWDKFSTDMSEKDFKFCDNGFLNDIHEINFFRNKEIGFSGSLLQTKNDESPERGILIWEWDKLKYIPRFVQVPNSFGYITYEITDLDKFNLDKVNPPAKDFICQLLYTGSELCYSFTKINEIKKELKSRFPTNQFIIRKKFNDKKSLNKTFDKTQIQNFFKEYLKKKNINDETIKELEALDKYYNTLIDSKTYQTGEYFIQEIVIHNFLCYGPNNVLDFKEIEGLVGLFGQNHLGKTSLFHAIMFCLFNKTPKNLKSHDRLINDQLEDIDESYVQIKLILNGIVWKIKRSIILKQDGGTRIKLEVYEGEEEVARHLESRPQTDSQILAPILGDEEIFITTVLSSQKNSLEFIDNKNSERLDLIIRFLGILLYDVKHKLITETLKKEEMSRVILNESLEKLSSKQGLEKQQSELEIVIEENKANMISLEQIEKTNSTKLINLRKNIEKLNLLGTIKTHTELILEKNTIEQSLKTNKEDLKNENKELKIKKQLWDKDPTLKGKLNTWVQGKGDKAKEQEITKLELQVEDLNTQLNSEYCSKCGQKWLKVNPKKIKEEINNKTKKISALKEEIRLYDLEQKRLNTLKQQINDLVTETQELDSNIIQQEKELKEINSQLKTIEENKVKIKQKEEWTGQIENLEKTLKTTRASITELKTTSAIKTEQVKNLKEKIKDYDEKVLDLKQKDNLINNLGIYRGAMHRTGVPLMILENFIPVINFEVNSYLTELFDFTIEFELEENNLNIYYVYDNLNKFVKRNIDQACGQESTVINLAIRAALTKISLLPKPSLLLLDEVFSMLDIESLEKMKELILRLREQYQNIILITHDEQIKEWPEHLICLNQINGVTTIIN